MRQVLDAKMKELSRKGLGVEKKQAGTISPEQENQLWEKEIPGTDTHRKLVDTLLYLIGLNFALRASLKHRTLRVVKNSQLRVIVSKNGTRFLEYTEDVSKSNTGGLEQRKVTPKVTQAYEYRDNPVYMRMCVFEKGLFFSSSKKLDLFADSFTNSTVSFFRN